MAKLKSMDAEAYPRELFADDEPKYLRRQKPAEVKGRKSGRNGYLRAMAWSVAALASAFLGYHLGRFLLTSPQMVLVHPDQVVLNETHYVPRVSVLEIFAPDAGKSILRVPLAERRRQLEAIPWVERATVRRALPNRIEVEISERAPIAFLREGGNLALVDVHGVILDRPLEGDFHFPVVTGVATDMSPADRERRMQLFAGFTQQLESARAGALEQVSEVDLSDEHDVRAVLTGFESMNAPGDGGAAASPAQVSGAMEEPVLVHFGDSDFAAKYRTLAEKISEWRATAGHVQSVDLRFSRQAVVSSDTAAPASQFAAGEASGQTAQQVMPAAQAELASPAKQAQQGSR